MSWRFRPQNERNITGPILKNNFNEEKGEWEGMQGARGEGEDTQRIRGEEDGIYGPRGEESI